MNLPSLNVNGYAIRTNPENLDLISLTDLHRAAGGKEDQRPYDWLRRTEAMTFVVATLAEKLNTAPSRILETKRGRAVGGTYAHWQIALAYAKYLSPELHMAVNEVYMHYRSESRMRPGHRRLNLLFLFMIWQSGAPPGVT